MVDKLSDKQIYEYLKGVNEQVYDCIVDEDINALNGIIEGVETSGIMDLPNYNDVVKYYRYSEISFFFGGVSFPYQANELLDPFIAHATNGYDIETIRRMHEDDFFAFMVNLENGEMPKKLTPREEAYIKFKDKMEHLYDFDGAVVSNDLITDDLAYIKILTDRVHELILLKQKFSLKFDFGVKAPDFDCKKLSEKEKLKKLTSIVKSMYVDANGNEKKPDDFLTFDRNSMQGINYINYMRGKYLNHMMCKNYYLEQKLPPKLLFYVEMAFYLCIPGSKEIEKFLNLHGRSFNSDLGVLEDSCIFGKYPVRYKDLRRWIDIGLSYNTINSLMGFKIQISEKEEEEERKRKKKKRKILKYIKL